MSVATRHWYNQELIRYKAQTERNASLFRLRPQQFGKLVFHADYVSFEQLAGAY